MAAFQLSLSVAVLYAWPASCAADWNKVATLPSSSTVKVRDIRKQQILGRLDSVTADEICVATTKGRVCKQRSEVNRVRVQTGRGRARNAAVAAAVGGGIFAALLAVALVVDQTGDGDEVPRLFGYGVSLIAAISAGIAALFPGYSTVYDTR